jgi:hypothetical protein
MDRLKDLKKMLKEAESLRLSDDYPGQTDEFRRQRIIEMAMEAADEIIMEGSDGSEEETNFLTSAVAVKMVGKVHFPIQGQLLRRDLEARTKPMCRFCGNRGGWEDGDEGQWVTCNACNPQPVRTADGSSPASSGS